MFETIGTNNDPEQARRRAKATLITTLLLSSALAFTVAAGSWTAVKLVNSIAIDDDKIVMVDSKDIFDVPDAPPAPKRLGGGATARKGVADAPVDDVVPDEAPEVTPSELPQPNQPLSDSLKRGTADGTGQAATTVNAPAGMGSPDGEVGGGAGLLVVHHTESRLRRSIPPVYPEGMTAQATCRARVVVGVDGRPQRVHIDGCPAPFVAATRRAMLRWRWAKPKMNGVVRPIQTVYRVRFEPTR